MVQLIARAVREPVPLSKEKLDHIHAVLTLAVGLSRKGTRLVIDNHTATYCPRSGTVYVDRLRFPSLYALKLHACPLQ